MKHTKIEQTNHTVRICQIQTTLDQSGSEWMRYVSSKRSKMLQFFESENALCVSSCWINEDTGHGCRPSTNQMQLLVVSVENTMTLRLVP